MTHDNDNDLGGLIVCTADRKADHFTDGRKLDEMYLGLFRPHSVNIEFVLQVGVKAHVETSSNPPHDDVVVIETKQGVQRMLRSKLGVQWDRERQEFMNFILKFNDARPELTDRGCIWIRPHDEIAMAHFVVRPRAFGEDESIAELVKQARQCIAEQFLSVLEPA